MKIFFGCDHAGYEMKLELIKLAEKNFEIADLGCGGEPVDYPDIAAAVCEKVLSNAGSFGVLVCGTGIGMSIAANKFPGIRAAVCSDTFSAKYTRLHNDANILCLGARVIGTGSAAEVFEVFAGTEFEGGRHAARVEKISLLEKK
ncbi:ribose 5-phosphate isomerase B [Clostridia bacterium]|nr:ribose 5-phosphate isomerase B [Clostridia bacterium]